MMRRVSKSKGEKERKDPLLIAIKNDDIDAVSKATDVNEKRENVYPLIYAIKKGKEEAVRMLINLGANVQTSDGNDSPLFVAAGYPNGHVVELLLNFGADPNYVNEFGENPLLNACEHGQVDNVRLLYDATDVEHRDKWGNTPLLKCSYSRKADSVLVVGKFLLEKGVEVDAKNEYSETPLICACKLMHWGLIQELVKAGANINHKVREIPSDSEECEIREIMAFEYLLTHPKLSVEKVKFMIDNGADVSNVNMFETVKNQSAEVIQLMIDCGVDLDSEESNGYCSVLRCACNHRKGEIVKLLLDNGAGPETDDGVVEAACAHQSPEIIKLLVEKGFDVNFWQYESALMNAIINQPKEIVHYLLDHGASDPYCLVHACEHGDEEMVRRLLDNGCHIEERDHLGVTPLMIASRRRKEDIVKLLIEKGADVCAKDEFGLTYKDYATLRKRRHKRGHKKTLE